MTTDDAGAKPPEVIDEVAALVRLANTSSPIAPLDEARFARVRTAVHGAWRDEYVAEQAKTRRRWLIVVAPLAAVSVFLAFLMWGSVRTPAPVVVGHLTAGDAVMSNSTITTAAGTMAMTFTNGVHLRLDASSAARVDSVSDITLERGAVYVDSADAHPAKPDASVISIHTPAGLVRDIGTQFAVRLAGAGIRIQVRDGQVRVTDANGMDAHAGAGEELFSDGAAGLETRGPAISRRPIAVTGSEWAWAERAAPAFSMDGKTLGAFLDWVSREGAWTVTFADSRFSEGARATVLHGKPDLLRGLTSAEALDVVLRICGLRHRIDGRRVVIDRQQPIKGATP